MRKMYGQTLVVMLLALGLFAAPRVSTVFASGSIYLNPATITSQPVGSTFSVQVKVSEMDQFNGWEIQIVSDSSVISPTSITTDGNIFVSNATGGIPFELRNCVNGSGQGCCLSSCSPLDGAGISDSAYGYTKPVSGSGLLFTVTFQVVSSAPYSPITIQNDQFSNGGGDGVVHTTTSGSYGSSSSIAVSKFFTDGNFDALPLDSNGSPSVNVVLARGTVESTNPGQILAWANITNTGLKPLESLSLRDMLPVDWQVSPSWIPPKGAIHFYYANTTSLETNPDLTDPSTITVSASNPETISFNVPSLNDTGIGHPLLQGQSILLSAKLSYNLDQTSQSFASYPRTYTDTATAVAYTRISYAGIQTRGTGSASFTAHAKVLGDANGDGNVNIFDVGLILGAFGSSPSSFRWNPNADFDNDGYIGINDVTIALAYYDTSS